LDWLIGQPAGYLCETGQKLADHARRHFSLTAMHERYSAEFSNLTQGQARSPG